MEPCLEIVALVVVASLKWRAPRHAWASRPPLVLVVVGIVASVVPGVHEYGFDPDVVLFGVLPPLLYAAALRTSLVDVRANNQAIPILAVGAVLFTTALVGLVTWAVLPGIPFAAAFALGAVVAPPDAVAATAVARRVGMPRRIVSILEGESLLNDATALVSLRTAIAAFPHRSGCGRWAGTSRGPGVGERVGWGCLLVAFVRRQVPDPVLDTSLSFIAPFLAYLPAKAIHAGWRARGRRRRPPARAQVADRPVRLVPAERADQLANGEFILENVVFLLIGLQVPAVH